VLEGAVAGNGGCGCEEGVDRGRQAGFEPDPERGPTMRCEFRVPGGRVQQTAQNLVRVVMQSLPQGKGVNGQQDAENDAMPCHGFSVIQGRDVALEEAVIPKRAQPTELFLSDAGAGAAETQQAGLATDFRVQLHQFPKFTPAGVPVGAADGGKFQGAKGARGEVLKELADGGKARQTRSLETVRGHSPPLSVAGGREAIQQRGIVPGPVFRETCGALCMM
jgi:hypothetical protein